MWHNGFTIIIIFLSSTVESRCSEERIRGVSNPEKRVESEGFFPKTFRKYNSPGLRYFNMIGETMLESETPMEKLVDNMKKRKIADYFQDCLCTESNHRFCYHVMSKFYLLSGFTKSVWKSQNKIDLDNFAVQFFRTCFCSQF